MKKSFLLLISLILICGLASVGYAEFDPVYFNFEDYTGGTPANWMAERPNYLDAAQIDELHGTSLRMTSTEESLVSYSVPEAVSEGKFLISFDFYATSQNAYLLTNMSTEEGETNHYLFSIRNAAYNSADTSLLAWRFSKAAGFEANTWYSVDMLLDMDTNKLSHYVDGVLVAEEGIGFSSFKSIICRNMPIEGAQLCLDNFSFKYLSEGSFSTVEEAKAVSADNKKLNLLFGDLVNHDTLSNIKVFDCGTNPLAYKNATEVGYRITKKAAKSVEIELNDPMGLGKIYKVDIDGVMSSFGFPYANTSSYISTVGEKVDKKLVDADFSTNAGTGATSPIEPENDALWVTGGREDGGRARIKIDASVYPMSVNFMGYANGLNTATLTRTFETAYTDYASMEFKLNSIGGMQSFIVTDSDGDSLEVVKIINGEVFVPGTAAAVGTIDLNSWETFSVKIDTEAQDAKVYIGDTLIAGNIDASVLSDFKSVIFKNENYYNAQDDLVVSQMYLAQFTMYGKTDAASVTSVTFKDVDGNTVYPEDDIDTAVTSMAIRFSSDMDDTSFTQNSLKLLISTESGLVAESLSGWYDESKKTYTVTLSNYLEGNADYVLKIDGVTDEDGLAIKPVEAPFKTKSGVMTAKNLSLIMDDTTAGIVANIVHTDKSFKPSYIIFTEYKNNIMINAEYQKITPAQGQRAISINTMASPYTRTPGADRASVFVWDGFDTMIPLARMQNGVLSAE